MTVLNNEEPADPSVHEPVETVPWPTVTRYSGGASHEGIGGRVWIRLSDDGPEVEYVPAGATPGAPHPADGLDPDNQIDPSDLIGQFASAYLAWNNSPMENDVRERYRNALAALYERMKPATPPAPAGTPLPSEAVYGFAAWLTTCPTVQTHEAAVMAERVAAFVASQEWAQPREHYIDRLKPYPGGHRNG